MNQNIRPEVQEMLDLAVKTDWKFRQTGITIWMQPQGFRFPQIHPYNIYLGNGVTLRLTEEERRCVVAMLQKHTHYEDTQMQQEQAIRVAREFLDSGL